MLKISKISDIFELIGYISDIYHRYTSPIYIVPTLHETKWKTEFRNRPPGTGGVDPLPRDSSSFLPRPMHGVNVPSQTG